MAVNIMKIILQSKLKQNDKELLSFLKEFNLAI